MKVTVSYDFGKDDLVSPSDIKITANIETTLGNSFFIPEIRAVIAGGLAPILRHLHITERSIDKEIDALMMSGFLFDNLEWPYYYDCENKDIRSRNDKEIRYSIRDYLEGKVPPSVSNDSN